MMLAYIDCVRRVVVAFGRTGLPDLPDDVRICIMEGCREYAAGKKRVSRVIRECVGHA